MDKSRGILEIRVLTKVELSRVAWSLLRVVFGLASGFLDGFSKSSRVMLRVG